VPGIPYHVPSCWVPVWGELGGGNSLAARELAAAAGGESGSLRSAVLFCVFSLSVSLLLLLFPLFAVLLNCPHPDPPVSACFFPFSSPPRWRRNKEYLLNSLPTIKSSILAFHGIITVSLSATSTYLSYTSRDGDSTTSLSSLFQCLITLLAKKFFRISKPPLAQLEAISSHLITSYLGEETDTHLATISFQVVVESSEIYPEDPLFSRLNSPSSLSRSS